MPTPAPLLAPCPFCGVQPRIQGLGFAHLFGDGKCILAGKVFAGIETPAWNRRSDPVREEALAACEAFIERFDSGQGRRADTDYVAGLMRATLARAKGETA